MCGFLRLIIPPLPLSLPLPSPKPYPNRVPPSIIIGPPISYHHSPQALIDADAATILRGARPVRAVKIAETGAVQIKWEDLQPDLTVKAAGGLEIRLQQGSTPGLSVVRLSQGSLPGEYYPHLPPITPLPLLHNPLCTPPPVTPLPSFSLLTLV